MRGIILSGGLGTRLGHLTKVINKHLLPIYDRPMIYYPIQTLVNAGIKEILIVLGGNNPGDFISLLKNGEDFGVNITYVYQSNPTGGIANALALAENFSNKDSVSVILGDNCTDFDIKKSVDSFNIGSKIFLKEVEDPQNFGVVKFNNEMNSIIEIIEKPINPPSNYAVTGLYIFDNKVFEYIKNCKISARGQLEIVDVINQYIQKNSIEYEYLTGYWHDTGNPVSLLEASQYWYNKSIKK